MEYYFNSENLTERSFRVKQFENSVTTVAFAHPNVVDGTDLTSLTPVLLVSTGDVVPVGEELSYDSEVDHMTARWCINERYTSKAGSFFVQLAFSDEEENIKLYSEKLMMIVEPSIDYQRDFLEYNPLFIEKFRKEIIDEITERIPTKTSDLENDSGYLNKERDLSLYATNEYVDSLAQQFETKNAPMKLHRFTAPSNPSKVVENVDIRFDSTGKYVETIFISCDSDGYPFALRDAAVYIRRTVSMGKNINMKVYANAENIDDEGTMILNCDSFMEQSKPIFGSVTMSMVHERWKSQCMRQERDNGEGHNILMRSDCATLGDDPLTSIKFVFTPDSPPTTNILSATSFEFWGTEA